MTSTGTPHYDLHSLGWYSFQQLCHTITREILGQTVRSFLESHDAGKDGAFTGTWNPTGNEDLQGEFVIQCKFTGKRDRDLQPLDLKEELPKAKRLAERGQCDCYVLITNEGVSGSCETELRDMFKAVGVKHFLPLGRTWICQQIHESPRLRMLVPRIYGLGDLSQILDERAYKQARALLASMREDLAKVVVTTAYQRAATALNNHGFVLLIGEPAAGKTTIASLLAMAAIDQWRAPTLKLDDPASVVRHWNPDEPSQFFWLDDAFGVTQYESNLVSSWNHNLYQVRAMINSGAKIVMTSRDYIYHAARTDLKRAAFPLLEESQVVIYVHELSLDEKRQILYNHIKLGTQPQAFREGIKPFLETVSHNSHFVPEIARRIGSPSFTTALKLTEEGVTEFVERREQFVRDVIEGLDADSKAALALLYMRNGSLESPITLQTSEAEALVRLGSQLSSCTRALGALNGSIVSFATQDEIALWKFKHPTIADAYSSLLVQDPELLGIYIAGATAKKLLEQITCGDVGITNAVVIPKSLFGSVVDRLKEYSDSIDFRAAWRAAWDAKAARLRFLSTRCSKDFLSLYIEANPKLLEEVSRPGLMLSAHTEVDLALRLFQFGILPEANRKQFVDVVSDYALNAEDLSAVSDDRILPIYRGSEFDELLGRIREELIPSLDHVVGEWKSNFDGRDTDPYNYMDPLREGLSNLKEHFVSDQQTLKELEKWEVDLEEWVSRHASDWTEPTHDRILNNTREPTPWRSGQSIFDDVDE